MKPVKFKLLQVLHRLLPFWAFSRVMALVCTDDDVEKLIKLGKANKHIEDMISAEGGPIFLRDDLVCMKCSKDIPPLPEGGGELPFVFLLRDGVPEIYCAECGAPP